MLARLGATFIVSGHTVVATTGVTQRFANRVFLLDTGMLKEEYKGRASALEVQDGRFTAYYADGDPKSLPAPGAARRSPDRTEALAFSRQD
jgi:hypothetical protein